MNARQNVVHLPTQPEVEAAKVSSRMLSKYADADRVQMSLRGSNGQAEDLVLPGSVLQLLLDILSEMAKGNAISLVPIHAELTTQQAADFLAVSRPHLVGLLDRGAIAHHKVGTHRRIYFQDVLEYRKQRMGQSRAALDALTEQAQKLGLGY